MKVRSMTILELLMAFVIVALFLILRELKAIGRVLEHETSFGSANAIVQINSAINSLTGTGHITSANDGIGTVNELLSEIVEANQTLTSIEERLSTEAT